MLNANPFVTLCRDYFTLSLLFAETYLKQWLDNFKKYIILNQIIRFQITQKKSLNGRVHSSLHKNGHFFTLRWLYL